MIVTAMVRSLLATTIFATTAFGAAVSVEDWSLSTRVLVGGLGDVVDGSGVPSNNFSETFSASVSNSTAFSNVSAFWDAAGFFNFLIEGEHALQGAPAITFARSTGFIFVTPQVDSVLTISSEYNYALAAGDREAIVNITAGEPTTAPFLSFFQRRLTLGGDSTGQIAYQSDSTLLSAGVEYVLHYSLQLTSFSGSATDLSMGDGFVHMQISPVPTPSSGAVLLVGAAALLRRKCRGRCAS